MLDPGESWDIGPEVKRIVRVQDPETLQTEERVYTGEKWAQKFIRQQLDARRIVVSYDAQTLSSNLVL